LIKSTLPPLQEKIERLRKYTFTMFMFTRRLWTSKAGAVLRDPAMMIDAWRWQFSYDVNLVSAVPWWTDRWKIGDKRLWLFFDALHRTSVRAYF